MTPTSIYARHETTSEASRPLALMRSVALITIPAGAVGSEALMLYVGRHNHSQLLLAIFTVWVLSPFIALAGATVRAKRWPAPLPAALYGVGLAVSLVSLVLYVRAALGPPGPRTTPVFVMVPPVSWMLMVIVSGAAAFLTRRRSRRGKSI